MEEKVGGEVSDGSDAIVARVNELNREMDALVQHGRQMPRRTIIAHGYRGGYVDGYQDGLRAAHEENLETLKELLEGRGKG